MTDTDTPTGAQPVRTAFLVVVSKEGKAVAYSDLSEIDRIEVAREAEADDFGRACAEIVEDVQASKIANTVVMFQAQMAMQAQRAAADQRLVQGLQIPGV